MNGIQFDSLARSLTTTGSRRRAMATTLGGALALVLGASSIDEAAAKKKKACPPCKKRNKQGRCKAKKSNGAACRGGTCQGGRCVAASVCPPGQEESGGVCAIRPSCKRFQASCDRTTPEECCSGGCFGAVGEPDACLCGSSGETCLDTSDCCLSPSALTCVGFVCRP